MNQMNTPQSNNGNLTDAQIRAMTRVFVAFLNNKITLEELVAELRRDYDPKAAYLEYGVIHTNGELVRLEELAEVLK